MIITLSLCGLILLLLIVSRINLSIQFSKQVKELFAQSGDISGQVFRSQQVVDLPEPVQRYFKHILKEGQPYIGYASLRHDGQFKTGLDKDWINIKGEQYFTTAKPGFIWKGVSSMFTARDLYISDKGGLKVSLLSLFTIVNGKGEKFNQGELLRWLSENIWFPTNLLPGDRLDWSSIDAQTARLTFDYNDISLFLIASFNAIGEITQLETKRYLGEGGLETWLIKLNNYKEFDGILVPTSAEAIWKLTDGDHSYAKFNVRKLVYNKPSKL
ncbi:hypothetical protein ADIARSV_0107 [Arcticibacter svalbardensis MN12-7]|uniref:Uncharacterized protein n=1 Tax=Arcticibacter svalbardensis MN12-7 TaxID=1150600 RepID=R9H6B9_9SPHI|nr:DUF6544 family protein [Arcticibacter svalbardensis]EOR96684.1 hypothetical protein ADIARSV_0107 [Arcticibacter svalbardensis MN12-7]